MNKFIKELKSHEKRYTIILVIIFIVLILGGFYYALSVDNKVLEDNNKKINYRYSLISSSYQVITVTKKTNKYTINIENNTNDTIKYKVLLLEDTNTKNLCECKDKEFNTNDIKYSIGNKINNLKDNIIAEGTLSKNKTIDIDVNIWLDKNSSNDHFHGYFKIIK